MQGSRVVKYRISLFLSVCLVLTACAAPDYAPTTKLDKISQITLPAGLSETSGLYCHNDHFLTINDSGNLPLVHTLDRQGAILSSQRVRHANTDWEAITVYGDTLVIADIGNNRGKRTDLSLITVAQKSGETLAKKPLGYADNRIAANQAYAHDYDAEALTLVNDSLYLFSKSWASHVARVYRFTLDDDLSALKPSAEIEGLPGVVTGADWDARRQQFVLVGYLSDPFGNFDAFIARLDANLKLLDTWPLTGFKQVEGLCVSSQGEYWITQEADDNTPAILAQFRLIGE